jgi:uncharacterized membrane protein YozB (DUF420 family)
VTREAGSATTSEMDFCDLIVGMEQAEISPRPVVGAIVVLGGLAVSFLLWLLYVHHASADFAGRSISYIANHALHGDTNFPGNGPVRTLCLSILARHVILSIVALPMVLTTFLFSLTGRFAMHRRIARLTFPIWLYV